MLRAYPSQGGLFRLIGDKSSETYYKREKIKALGGQWDGRVWMVPQSAIKDLQAHRMVKIVASAHCHETETTMMATEEELAAGEMRLGCGFCDTSRACGWMVPIREIVNEEDSDV